MSRARKLVAGALVALALFTAYDHGMRVEWAQECETSATLRCPDRLWWFDRSCETDSECAAVTDGRLVW